MSDDPIEGVLSHAQRVAAGAAHVVPGRRRLVPSLTASRRRYAPLLDYGKRHRRGWFGILLTTLLSTGTAMLAPLPLKVLVDNVLGHHRVPHALAWLPGAGNPHALLVWVVVAELAVFGLATVLDVAGTFLWTIVGQGMVFDVIRDVFARVQRRSLREHSRQPVGDTIERVAGDSWSVHTVIDEIVFTPLHSIVTIAGVVFVMWTLSPHLTIIAFAVAPLMAMTSIALGRPIRSVSEKQREVQGQMHSHIQQTLSGIPVVQAFSQEERQNLRFVQLAAVAVSLQTRSTLISAFNQFGSGFIQTLGTALVVLLGAHEVLHGSLTIGGLLAFIVYVGTLQSQLGGLTGIYTALQGTRPSIDRVVEVLDAPADVGDRPGALALARVGGEVAVEGVGFSYEAGRPVLHDITFAARPGEVVAIVGQTGAGKSTLVGLIPRFFDPDRGRVLLDGHDLRDLRLKTVRDSVALVLQESFLFPFSIAENIAYGRPGATRTQIAQAARAANAHQFITRLPDGYDTVVGERGATLSGGERQRVAIARALLKDAPVLILDEPTSALDAETEGLLLEALERLMTGRTTIIIAHRLSTIRQADLILVLRDGQIIERGSHRQLLATPGTYARMHTIQHGAENS